MNPEEDKIFFVFGCSTYTMSTIFIIFDSRMEVRRYRRMDINGFNMVLEKFSFDLKVS